MKRLLFLLLFIAPSCFSQQQVTFSQYMFHGLLINPAYASSDEALNLTFTHRKQWTHINGAPQIQSLTGHKYNKQKRMGFGGMMENLSYGVTKMFNLSGVYSYSIETPKKNKLSFGLRAGLSSNKMNLTDLALALPDNISDPSFDHNTTRTLFNTSFGTYYETPKFYVGLSISGLVKNKLDNNDVGFLLAKQVPHYFLTGGYLHDLSEDVKLKGQILVRAVSGAPINVDYSIAGLIKEIMWIGFTFKYDNSINGLLDFKINDQFRFGFAYDIVASQLQNLTPGTYELRLNYRYLKQNPKKIMSPRYF